LFLLSPRAYVNGIEIVDIAEEESELTIACLREALNVLRLTDSRRYRRLKQDLGRIAIVRAGGPDFAPEVNACLLRSRYVRDAGPGAIATSLIHEATHARLWRLGVGYAPRLRARVEKICVEEQIAFAKRLGDPFVLAQLEAKMQRPWWTPSQLHERRITALKQLGLPEWILRSLRSRVPRR
jgi:hypothetical protein